MSPERSFIGQEHAGKPLPGSHQAAPRKTGNHDAKQQQAWARQAVCENTKGCVIYAIPVSQSSLSVSARRSSMKRVLVFVLLFTFLLNPPVSAGLDSRKAAYQGGTMKEKHFPGATDPVVGDLNTSDEASLKFSYRLKSDKTNRVYAIPYKDFIDIEYGQKAGRRVGASIATAILISPVGLFLLFSKKRKHYVTIGYRGEDGREEVAVFELGKDIVRTTLPILEARSGKKIEYQDEEARKSGKGN
ncbi:hypothetical protein J8C02_12795 [Chloracidobacterium sp. MS 40/45]|uniref:hypothetical protein n=1 Tax=Chloracidobacterium aggregatum TaxID=2851959 RepID=UPI001B8BB7E8|nr:hypothetical protein [Chloracidobacterium aggregatum]QUW01758.1 hypothetical protein J8C02_12795 [Chloracidobacterium sp. MS 40/45]